MWRLAVNNRWINYFVIARWRTIFFLYNLENNELSFSTLKMILSLFFSFNFCLVFPQEIVSLKYILFHFVLIYSVSFRSISFRSISFRFISFRLDFVSVNFVSFRSVSHVSFRVSFRILQVPLLQIHHHNSFFTTYNKMKKKYHIVGKVPKIQ